jgi:hypothetical protein
VTAPTIAVIHTDDAERLIEASLHDEPTTEPRSSKV